MFSDEEVKQLDDAFLAAWRDGGGVLKVAIKTAELLAARGDALGKWELAELDERCAGTFAETIRSAFAAQGARVAVLEKEQNDAFDLLGRLRSVDEQYSEETKLRERLHSAEESVRELTRRAQHAEAERDNLKRALFAKSNECRDLRDRCAALSAAGQVLSEHVDKAHECAWAPAYDGQVCHNCSARRYPCSATCTHDDAKTPGHPERVTERSERFAATTSPESLAAGYVRLDDTATLFGARTEAPTHPTEVARREGFNEGAEAMRAACLEAARDQMEQMGATNGDWDAMKAAIEGATP